MRQLRALVARSSSFARVDLGSHSGGQKISWETRQPGATLALCLEHAPTPPENESHERESGARKYMVALGFMVSHRMNPPLFGNVTVRCDGGCACSETRMDTLIDQQVTVTRFMRLRTTVSSPAPAAVSRLDPEIPTFLPSHWIRKFRHSCPLSKCTVLVSKQPQQEGAPLRRLASRNRRSVGEAHPIH